ncbi:MAG TPA: SRPBCC family protein [Thermoanaerobaculia bacterium]|nr:SRPBCC family protein [Thermoanaerobaculia bacterium]
MTTTVDPVTAVPVRKGITVKAPVERAFKVFTEGFDSWWPRSHHIGKSPLAEEVLELRVGGRCYGRCIDGSECDWGSILVLEPPHRLVLAWQITTQWQFEPDLAKSSEVEVRFTPQDDGSTRVELEHRHLDRHGLGADAVRAAIDSPNGWGGILALYAVQAEGSAAPAQ